MVPESIYYIATALGVINSIFSAVACPIIAYQKGRSAVGWFFGGLFLGFIGLIIVACLPKKYF